MLNVTLKQLKYIEAAGRLGSIANAASELNISQSSITAAISAIEQTLGYDIFVRTPAKGVQITPSGQETLQLIRNFIDQSKHFESELKSIDGVATGTVRIACYVTAAPSFLPSVLQGFSKSFPNVQITLLEGNMERILEFLLNGEADLAFTYSDSLDQRVDFSPLFGAPPFALVNTDDPLSQQASVSIRELASRPMVLLDLPQTRSYFLGMFEQYGLEPDVVHSTRSSEIARALVSGGFGFSILNIIPADYHSGSHAYKLLPISDTLHVPVFGIASQANMRQPKIINSFIDHCIFEKNRGSFQSLIVNGSFPT